MGFLHQLHLLLWKNISLKRRGPVSQGINSYDTLWSRTDVCGNVCRVFEDRRASVRPAPSLANVLLGLILFPSNVTKILQ